MAIAPIRMPVIVEYNLPLKFITHNLYYFRTCLYIFIYFCLKYISENDYAGSSRKVSDLYSAVACSIF
jgi:hypothetical protein